MISASKETVGTFSILRKGIAKKKKNQKMFRIEKVIKTKGDNLHVQWKSCDIPFNVWIDKKDIVI